MAAEPSDPLQNFGIALEIICPVFALIVTILRVYTRLKIKSFGWGTSTIHSSSKGSNYITRLAKQKANNHSSR